MKLFVILALAGLVASVVSQQQQGRSVDDRRPTTTPVPILRSVNKVNEDGSYTYGYENADGSYKIETKDTAGQVQGKYGYYDDTGSLREVEYGASRNGFYPTGTGINAPEVAPHTPDANAPTDGSYDPNLYEAPYRFQNEISQAPAPTFGPNGRRLKTVRRPAAARQLGGFQQPQQQQYQQQQQQYQQQQQQYQQQQPQQQRYQQPAAAPVQQQQYQQPGPTQQEYYQPQPQQPQTNYYQAQPQAPAFNQASHFQGHPARNIDLNTGSYSVNYAG